MSLKKNSRQLEESPKKSKKNEEGFLTTNIQLLCILISVLICSCTSTFQGKLIEAHTEINEDPYSSSFVSLGAEGDCVVFRLPFAGGVDKALKK